MKILARGYGNVLIVSSFSNFSRKGGWGNKKILSLVAGTK
jgi:hypothetical protein